MAPRAQELALRKAFKLFNALILDQLLAEQPAEAVAATYFGQPAAGKVNAVDVKYVLALQDRAAKLCGMLAAFCERQGRTSLELLLAKFQSRVFHGVKPEVVVLTAIPGVRGVRARMLYDAGLRAVEDVATASAEDLCAALMRGRDPSCLRQERKCAGMIGKAARRLLQERADESLEAGVKGREAGGEVWRG